MERIARAMLLVGVSMGLTVGVTCAHLVDFIDARVNPRVVILQEGP